MVLCWHALSNASMAGTVRFPFSQSPTMPEEIEIDTDKLRETIDEEIEHQNNGMLRSVALSTAIFAALAAVTSLQAGSTVNEALIMKNESAIAQAQASDAWSYYQAKGLRAALAHSDQEAWKAQGKAVPPNLQADEVHYLSDQRSHKDEAIAKEHERDVKSAEADHTLREHEHLAQAVAFLQVGIALGAVAALTRKRWAWLSSMGLGVAGAGLFGFALLAH